MTCVGLSLWCYVYRYSCIDHHCDLLIVPGSETSGCRMGPAAGALIVALFLRPHSPAGLSFRSSGLSGLWPAGVSLRHREVSSETAVHDPGAQPPVGTSEHSTVPAPATLHRDIAVDLDGHCLMVAAIADADELGQVCLTGQVTKLYESRYAESPDLRVRPPLETF